LGAKEEDEEEAVAIATEEKKRDATEDDDVLLEEGKTVVMMLAMTTRCFTGKDAMERTEEEEEGEEKQQQKARLFGEVLVDKSFSNSSSSSSPPPPPAAPAAGVIVQTLVVAQTANDDGVVVHENSLDDDKEQKEMVMIQEGEKLKQEPANDVDESGVQAMHLEENVKAEEEEEEQQQIAEEAEEDVPQQKAQVAAAAATIKPEDKTEQEEQDAAAEMLLLPPQASGMEEQQQEGDEGKVVKKEEPYHHQNDDNNNNNNRKRALGLVQERQKKQCRRGGGGGGHAVEERKKDEEDVCYICFDGGDLVMCDRRSCPKAYHLNCIGRDAAFFRKKGAWICGWHFCSSCTKPGSFQCYMCPIAYCGGCVKEADFCMLRKRKGLCEECLPIVIMIECSQTVNSEGVEVDFEDKETYECLFKEYWLGLKNRLSLTLPKLDKDGKLAKGICEDSEIGGSDTENQDPSDVDGLGTESDRESDQDEDDSLDGKNQSRKKIKVAPTLSEFLVVENKADAFTEGAEDKEDEENEDEQEEEDEEDDDGDDDDDDDVSEVQSRKIEGWASKEVLDFIVHMKADPMKPLTRFAVNHLLWVYIKRHQLQDPEKKSQILCDERLQAMFGKKLMGQSEMYRQLNEHFPPKDSANGAKSLKELDRTVKDDARETDGTEDKLDRDMAKDRRRGRRRSDEKFERPDGNDFAAISPKNIGLIYLRRALLENLLDDPEFNSKVVDTFVKIRVPGSVSTLDMCYRLVLVTGNMEAIQEKLGGMGVGFLKDFAPWCTFRGILMALFWSWLYHCFLTVFCVVGSSTPEGAAGLIPSFTMQGHDSRQSFIRLGRS
jgi:chromatin remodeling complex protein RSC6